MIIIETEFTFYRIDPENKTYTRVPKEPRAVPSERMMYHEPHTYTRLAMEYHHGVEIRLRIFTTTNPNEKGILTSPLVTITIEEKEEA